MKNFLNNHILNFIRKYKWYFILLNVGVIMTVMTITYYEINSYSFGVRTALNSQVFNKIYPISEICIVLGCTDFSKSDENLIHITQNTYINTKDLNIYIKHTDYYFKTPYSEYLIRNLPTVLILLVVWSSAFFFIIYTTYRREIKEGILRQANSEAMLSNKAMLTVTENIHHELNTPLEVIDNKIQKIHKTINEYIICENEKWAKFLGTRNLPEEKREINVKITKLEKDFGFIETSIGQITAILSKMKSFKSFRQSAKRKSIYNIAQEAFEIIGISNSDFNFSIDEVLKNHYLSDSSFSDGDLINILINHIKNSLEANSNELSLEFDNCTKGYTTIFFKDNGNGIPKNILKSIFEPNISSKGTRENIRGNGMYLNKTILGEVKGNIKVKETSINGTIISLYFPADCIATK